METLHAKFQPLENIIVIIIYWFVLQSHLQINQDQDSIVVGTETQRDSSYRF